MLKTYRVLNCYIGDKKIEAFNSGKKVLDIIVSDHNVDFMCFVLNELGYRLTRREY